jgi:hypothetical protein
MTFLIVVLAVAAGCFGRAPGRGLGTEADRAAIDQDAVAADLAELAHGKSPEMPASSVAYDQARDRLIAQGTAVEAYVHAGMRTSPDWGVRLGCVEVLTAVGTRASIDPLIEVLEDPEPLVALYANAALETMTQAAVIPALGGADASGLPPVPARDPADDAPDAEQRVWSAWHASHGRDLRVAWSAWWSAHRETAVIDAPAARATPLASPIIQP